MKQQQQAQSVPTILLLFSLRGVKTEHSHFDGNRMMCCGQFSDSKRGVSSHAVGLETDDAASGVEARIMCAVVLVLAAQKFLCIPSCVLGCSQLRV